MHPSSDQAAVFNDSYERVLNGTAARSRDFFETFYALLIATSPEAAEKFKDTDMDAQIRMLRTSVGILLSFFGSHGQTDLLEKLADRHGRRGVDIHPGLYSVWLDCLIETVSVYDARFDREIEEAWRAVFLKGIDFMSARYQV